MDAPPPPAPEPSPDPPPPYWRWETFASLGLIVALFISVSGVMDVSPLNKIKQEMLFTLIVSFFAFGIVLGFSGARQGGRANRTVAAFAIIFYLFLMLAIFWIKMLDIIRP